MPALSAAPRPLTKNALSSAYRKLGRGKSINRDKPMSMIWMDQKSRAYGQPFKRPTKSQYSDIGAIIASCPLLSTLIRKFSVEFPVFPERASRYVRCSIILSSAIRSTNSSSSFPRSRSHRPKPFSMKPGIKLKIPRRNQPPDEIASRRKHAAQAPAPFARSRSIYIRLHGLGGRPQW